MSELMQYMVNFGIGIVCIAYFMYRDFKFMGKLTELLGSLHSALEIIRKAENMNRRATDNIVRDEEEGK